MLPDPPSKGTVPRARISPLYKKNPVLIPGTPLYNNYYNHATSETLIESFFIDYETLSLT
jgi:hypothetical protein